MHRKIGATTDVVSRLLHIHRAAAHIIGRTEHNETQITHACKEPKRIRSSAQYKELMERFRGVEEAIENAARPRPDGQIRLTEDGADVVMKAVGEFEEAESELHALIRRKCPNASPRGPFLMNNHIELSCHGTEMPQDVREWMSKPDPYWVEKTVFCRVPQLLGHLMSKAGDVAESLGYGALGAGIKYASAPSARQMFKPGMKLHNKFEVRIVSGPFVGVARRKKENELKGSWWAAGAVAVGVAAGISFGLYHLLAMAAPHATNVPVLAGNVSAQLVQSTELSLISLKAGTLKSRHATPLLMLLANGKDLFMYALRPDAWCGQSLLMAFGQNAVVPRVAYRHFVNLLPQYQVLANLLAKPIAYLAQQNAIRLSSADRFNALERLGRALDFDRPVAAIDRAIALIGPAVAPVPSGVTPASVAEALRRAPPEMLRVTVRGHAAHPVLSNDALAPPANSGWYDWASALLMGGTVAGALARGFAVQPAPLGIVGPGFPLGIAGPASQPPAPDLGTLPSIPTVPSVPQLPADTLTPALTPSDWTGIEPVASASGAVGPLRDAFRYEDGAPVESAIPVEVITLFDEVEQLSGHDPKQFVELIQKHVGPIDPGSGLMSTNDRLEYAVESLGDADVVVNLLVDGAIMAGTYSFLGPVALAETVGWAAAENLVPVVLRQFDYTEEHIDAVGWYITGAKYAVSVHNVAKGVHTMVAGGTAREVAKNLKTGAKQVVTEIGNHGLKEAVKKLSVRNRRVAKAGAICISRLVATGFIFDASIAMRDHAEVHRCMLEQMAKN